MATKAKKDRNTPKQEASPTQTPAKTRPQEVPPTATVSLGPSHVEDLHPALPERKSLRGDTARAPPTPSRFAPHPNGPINTPHWSRAPDQGSEVTLPRNFLGDMPFTPQTGVSDRPLHGSYVTKITETISPKNAIVITPVSSRKTFPHFHRQPILTPYSTKTEPMYRRHRLRELRPPRTDWSLYPRPGSVITPFHLRKSPPDPKVLETDMWVKRNTMPDSAAMWVAHELERERNYIETPWESRRFTGQEAEVTDTARWLERNFGSNRDWLDTPYFDGRYYQYDRRYMDFDREFIDTREQLRKYYRRDVPDTREAMARFLRQDPNMVDTSSWVRRNFASEQDDLDYYLWLEEIEKRRARQLFPPRHFVEKPLTPESLFPDGGSLLKTPKRYDSFTPEDFVIRPPVPQSLVPVKGSVVKPYKMTSSFIANNPHLQDAEYYRKHELVPRWVNSVDGQDIEPIVSRQNKSESIKGDQGSQFTRLSRKSSIVHPPTVRYETPDGHYNARVGKDDKFNNYAYVKKYKRGDSYDQNNVDFKKYGNNYKSKNMDHWQWN